jgi:acetylornithine aminotransferase
MEPIIWYPGYELLLPDIVRAEGRHLFDAAGCAACPDARACDARSERWASIPHERIGGFLLEPGSSSGLVRFPPGKLITSIVRAVRDAGGLPFRPQHRP